MERGVPLVPVRDLILGHASILTAERYDNQRLEALQAAVERLDTGKTFDPVRLKPDMTDEAADNLSAIAVSAGPAMAEVSRIVHDPHRQSFADGEDPARNPSARPDSADREGLPPNLAASVLAAHLRSTEATEFSASLGGQRSGE